MANIPGAAGAIPGVYTDVQTVTSGVSVPGGVRLAAIMGEGARTEVIVSSALGGGLDGFNPTYASTSGADGRHFKLTLFPNVINRTIIYRNGSPLKLLEAKIDLNAFDDFYDCRVDPATGRIELQSAHLVDLGGKFYLPSTSNFGSGTIENLSVVDLNAPSETWTIKCVSVQRDGYGAPMTQTAKFLAFGSVSGALLDGYGNPIVWLSDNNIVSNGIIRFSVYQNPTFGSNNFKEGDSFQVKVESGVLLRNDSLTAAYISITDLNDPVFFDNMEDISKKHGLSSVDNNLTLGCQIAFSNATPGVVTLQTKPALPRRTAFDLSTSVSSTSTDIEEYIFPLPVGVKPDVNSNLHFFTTNAATGIETQVLPNKHPLFTVGDTSTTPSLNTFIFSTTTYAYYYTVIERPLVTKFGTNGTLVSSVASPGNATLTSASFTFTASDVGKKIKQFNVANDVNKGIFDITAVSSGSLNVRFPLFTSATAVQFQLVNSSGTVISTIGDGVITPNMIDGTKAVLGSASTDFSLISGLTLLNVKITASSNEVNNGKFLIAGVVSGNNFAITIKKYFVDETNVAFEVFDTTKNGSFVVVNQSVVPAGQSLRTTLIDDRDADFFDAGWLGTLAKLETVEVDIVVPLPKQTISAIFQNTLAHCRTMSNIKNKRERVLFCGGIRGLTPDNVRGSKLAAVEDIGVLEGIQGDDINEILSGNTEDLANYSVRAAFGNTFRAVYMYPDEIVVQAGTERVKIDGFYMAAAAAGFFCGTPNVAIPLTNKTLAGITILNDKRYSPTVLEQLVGSGITVVQPVSGGGKVIQGKTTTNSGFPEEEEISIIFIRDRIAKSLRLGFDGFVGNPEDDTTQGSLTSRAIGLLNSFTGSLITKYADLKVVRDSVDPRQWNISLRAQPIYPVNWIYIKVGIGVL